MGTTTRPAAAIEIARIQATLSAAALDGWLLYDFRGQNPIASGMAGVGDRAGHLATRRWFYLIPARGEPRGLVHAIEPDALAHLPGTASRYAGRIELEAGLARLLDGLSVVAMEYSPGCAIPYVSRVDAGTVEMVRQLGVDVRSSGDLIQEFSAVWDDDQKATHADASARLHLIKDRAFEAIARRLRDREPTSEHDVQQLMAGWFRDEGLITDSEPNVSAGANSGNPHYLPTAGLSQRIGADDLVLIDLWGKLDRPRAVFADITWVGYTGARVPDRYREAFAAVRDARDAAVDLVQQAVRSGRPVCGWEVDREAAGVLRRAGYADRILHRTGHSLGESVHGNGANLDDYETRDDRRLLPGSGFTIEPGVYFADFGVRTEINMIVHGDDATVSGPRQHDILTLGS